MNEEDGDAETAEEPECREGMYARVAGHLKMFHDQRSINAFNIRPVSDPNEVTQHMLDTLFHHLRCTRGPLEGPKQPAQGGAPGSASRPQAGAGGSTETYGGNFQARAEVGPCFAAGLLTAC